MNVIFLLTTKRSWKLLFIFFMVIIIGSQGSIIAQNEWSTISSGTSSNLEAVTYYDQTGTLIAVGDGIILRSTDLGRTWTAVSKPSVHLYAVQFSKNGKVHAFGSFAARYYSTDDGVTWKSDGSSGSTIYYAAAFPTVYVQGNYGDGVIVGSWPVPDITTDDGTTWHESSGSLTINKNYFGATFDGFTMLIVGGSGQIWRSTDLGATWIKESSGVTTQLRSVSSAYLSLSNEFACGNNGVALESTDSGVKWENISPPGVQTNFNSIIKASNTIVMVGQGGTILSTTNGSTWNSESSSTTNDLNCVVSTKNNELVAVGANGTILLYSAVHESPFGGTAATIPGKIEAENYDVGGNGVAYYDDSPGNTGGYYRNDDVDIDTCYDTGGGYYVGWLNTGEWMKYMVNVKESGNYTAIARVSSPFNNGIIGLTINGNSKQKNVPLTNGWQSWTDDTVGQFSLNAGPDTLRVDCVLQAYNINYIDFKLAVTSVKAKGELPGGYKLSQNYPNPFNPTTTIQYQLPEASKISIKIYNMLGEVVDELVNKNQNAGYYSVQWKPNLSSGVYIYRLTAKATSSGSEARSFVETKKLILLK